MIEIPMIGGMHSAGRTGPFAFHLVAAHALNRIATSCTAPNGMLKRIVSNGPKPNDSTMSGPKVEIPPDGMETAMSIENQKYVLTSRKTSLTWSHRQTPDEMP